MGIVGRQSELHDDGQRFDLAVGIAGDRRVVVSRVDGEGNQLLANRRVRIEAMQFDLPMEQIVSLGEKN